MSDRATLIRGIFLAFGSINEAARKMMVPVSTVYFWCRVGRIPNYRRHAVLREADRWNVKLTAEQRAFLAADERFPDGVPPEQSAEMYA